MRLAVNRVALEVEDHGSPQGEPLVLIMGLGMQLVAWHERFVASLVERGFRVIRFDNRDIGLSQYFDHLAVPNLMLDGLRMSVGLQVRSAYSLADMAADTAGILDALGLRSAHVCGASMGGMIAQRLAIAQPRRVRSLTLMMTTSGTRGLPPPSMKVRAAMMSRPADPRHVEGIIDHYVKLYRLIGSPGYPASEDYLRERLGVAVRRAYHPQGLARQLAAILADGDRSPLLESVRLPTQIIHGRDDPLVTVAAGHDLAAKLHEARLDVIDGMGHDLPVPLWPRFVDDIMAAAGRA
jgi:pimeloyl-ACP methyl ester carboxylesterase